ncbi:hypothetical protein [Peribacillus asahii]|uniref:hypothetical protein n=1 Tax=Peribacillus asahii TaxID=228899 RepID=UPI00207A0C30|nr:hypothetical protein [Peribacillus asahii]USK62193.1 hypothetical protein LIT37_23745 [Peribacillus asahii]
MSGVKVVEFKDEVGVSNRELANQIKQAMLESQRLIESCYTFESQQIEIMIRYNQLQQISFCEDTFKRKEEANGVDKHAFEVMVNLVHSLIKGHPKPFGHTVLQIRYTALPGGKKYKQLNFNTKACLHYKKA